MWDKGTYKGGVGYKEDFSQGILLSPLLVQMTHVNTGPQWIRRGAGFQSLQLACAAPTFSDDAFSRSSPGHITLNNERYAGRGGQKVRGRVTGETFFF